MESEVNAHCTMLSEWKKKENPCDWASVSNWSCVVMAILSLCTKKDICIYGRQIYTASYLTKDYLPFLCMFGYEIVCERENSGGRENTYRNVAQVRLEAASEAAPVSCSCREEDCGKHYDEVLYTHVCGTD